MAIGILGATVMPHNLYLHSALVQTRRIGADRREQGDGVPLLPDRLDDRAERGLLRQRGDPGVERARCSTATASRSPASRRRTRCCPHSSAGWRRSCSASRCLCAGQSSTLTGTLAGQIVMEGYLHLRIAPWLRRLVTRLLALVPAVAVIAMRASRRRALAASRAGRVSRSSAGEHATQGLLILSQVILSLQLSFAVIPLIHFTSNRRNMGEFATPWWGQFLAWTTAAIIVALNGKLVMDQIVEWIAMAEESRRRVGPIPLKWLVAAGLYGVAGGADALLAWVTIKPLANGHRRGGPSPA